ncbi:MAG: DegT/DnrJ/EryC1/StrS family aminotransferase [Planctomycetes bacterium]|nr:DegT/DnrJ/EryC1/StrS family aminotransferase [Planctomycetota bacterium]
MDGSVINYKRRIQQIYLPPCGNKYWRFEDIIGHNNIRYFSFGRHALAEGLIASDICKGDKVLIPGFICRDLLSAINSIGSVPIYYEVGKDLNISTAPEDLPDAKAILAVNYFGFAQNLSPFREYCNRTGAILIEDNAHGLFSKDEDGRLLGTRGDIGIFSLRKTVPIPDGAALVVNNPDIAYNLKPQLPFNSKHKAFSFKIKQGLRRLAPLIGPTSMQSAISAVRFLRKLRTGHEIEPSQPDAEFILPENPLPCSKLFSYLFSIDINEEIKRRIELYIWVDMLLKDMPCTPVFKTLYEQVVPYGYPFYSSGMTLIKIKKVLKNYAIRYFQWPDLPNVIISSAPEHYKTIWVVSFLW